MRTRNRQLQLEIERLAESGPEGFDGLDAQTANTIARHLIADAPRLDEWDGEDEQELHVTSRILMQIAARHPKVEQELCAKVAAEPETALYALVGIAGMTNSFDDPLSGLKELLAAIESTEPGGDIAVLLLAAQEAASR